MPKVTLASQPAVVAVHEGFLRGILKEILNEDSVGTTFLELHQKTALPNERNYHQLSNKTTERRVAAIVEKAKSQETTLKQLIGLHDFIKNKKGDNVALRIFKRQLQKRPTIPEPSPYSYRKLEGNMTKHRERQAVLLDYIKLNTEEANKHSAVLMKAKQEKEEAKEEAEQATARAVSAESQVNELQDENHYLRDGLDYASQELNWYVENRNELIDELEDRTRQLKEALDKIDLLTKAVEKLTREKNSMRVELDDTKVELNATKSRVDAVEKFLRNVTLAQEPVEIRNTQIVQEHVEIQGQPVNTYQISQTYFPPI